MRLIVKKQHRAAASLFIVVFFTLLVTVIVVGFVRLSIKDLQSASATDLSQSALDSAQAGVEDAKRALLEYESACSDNTAVGVAKCTLLRSYIDSGNCNDVVKDIAVVVNGEVKVQTTASDSSLNQAYTCVKVDRITDDFLGTLKADESKLIPIQAYDKTTSKATDVSYVEIQWFMSKNIPSNGTTVDLPTVSLTYPMQINANYPSNRPPILAIRIIQAGDNFTQDSLENSTNYRYFFLYPAASGLAPGGILANNVYDVARQTPVKAPYLLQCNSSLAAGGYACDIKIQLPTLVNYDGTAVAPATNGNNNHTQLIQITSLYNSTDYRVTMYNGVPSATTQKQFNGIQPSIDSTGRANGLYRRIQTRVEVVDAYPYPTAAADISGSLCKNFYVTDNTADYWQSPTCTP